MRPIDADTLIDELQKDEARFDKEAEDAQNNPVYTEYYSIAMWSRANGIRDAIIEIHDAPTIEPKYGEWIDEHENGHGFWVGVCSQCGEENLVDNYCPNCGAKIKRNAEEESIREVVRGFMELVDAMEDRKTEPKTTDYCNVCNHKGCDNCIADGSNPYCVPSNYEPKDEPQTEPLQTCSVNGRPYSECSSCEHFRCTADEPQTDNLFTDKDGDVWEWRGNAWYCISGDEPQTERSE